jgi:hypothetical protein
MENNLILHKFYICVYILIVIFLSYSPFSNNQKIISWSMTLCVFLLFKWIFDYHKCTISYIECKLRNVKKEDGYVYTFMENIININKTNFKYLIYFLVATIFTINLLQKKTEENHLYT